GRSPGGSVPGRSSGTPPPSWAAAVVGASGWRRPEGKILPGSKRRCARPRPVSSSTWKGKRRAKSEPAGGGDVVTTPHSDETRQFRYDRETVDVRRVLLHVF